MTLADLTTPALVVDDAALSRNLATMAAAFPGDRLRPHVKAHKVTALVRRQQELGHPGVTCATIREVEGLAAAGLGADLLLANEALALDRLRPVVDAGARVTVAVDSEELVRRAAAAGIPEVLVDVNVGLPRCGCAPEDAGRLADLARSLGLEVRGVMGYEGHLMLVEDPADRKRQVEECMTRLLKAHADTGGDIVSGGGTGTWAVNDWVTELQAGSYALMDTTYAAVPDVPFEQALHVLATVISVNPEGWAVCDAGLKAFGMDHGNPSLPGTLVWYCSDEHTVFSMNDGAPLPRVGDKVLLDPAHVDPTCALHERMHLVPTLDGVAAIGATEAVGATEVVDTWAVDLRGW